VKTISNNRSLDNLAVNIVVVISAASYGKPAEKQFSIWVFTHYATY